MRTWSVSWVLVCALALCIPACMPAPSGDSDGTPAASSLAREEMAAEIVNALAEQRYKDVTAHFDATMTRALPVEKLIQVWSETLARHGEFVAPESTKVKTIQGYETVFITCRFTKDILDIQVTLNAANEVAGLFIRPTE